MLLNRGHLDLNNHRPTRLNLSKSLSAASHESEMFLTLFSDFGSASFEFAPHQGSGSDRLGALEHATLKHDNEQGCQRH
jgi:hypothetical protein